MYLLRYKFFDGCVVIATQEEIEEILEKIRKRKSKWVLSPRHKNLSTLMALGVDNITMFNIIDDKLSWRDYCEGPEPDNHHIPGDIWIFGLTIDDHQCYLKFQDRPDETVMWISIHDAEHPVELLYK